MKQQKYRVTCECGKVHRVTSGEAGSSLPCVCGKTVVVPALSKLRESVVASADTPEGEFDARLRTGQLPIERTCVLCRCETEHIVTIHVQSQQEVPAKPILLVLLLTPCFGFLGALALLFGITRAARRSGVSERTLFDFPVRVCPKCIPRLADGGVALSAVKHTALYANLLAKHSWPEVTKVRWG